MRLRGDVRDLLRDVRTT